MLRPMLISDNSLKSLRLFSIDAQLQPAEGVNTSEISPSCQLVKVQSKFCTSSFRGLWFYVPFHIKLLRREIFHLRENLTVKQPQERPETKLSPSEYPN